MINSASLSKDSPQLMDKIYSNKKTLVNSTTEALSAAAAYDTLLQDSP